LASGSASGELQDGHSGLLVTVWYGSALPVSWSPTKVVVSCILPTQGHVSSDGPAAAMETDVLLLQVLGCGTVCQLI